MSRKSAAGAPSRIQTTTAAEEMGLLFPVLFLVGVGVVAVYSASSALALKRFGTEYFFLKRQAAYALLGILALAAARNVPIPLLRTASYPLLAAALLFLAATRIPGIGVAAGGSARWLRLGPLTFQPSEFARFALVLFLAYSMSKKLDRLDRFSIGFLPHLLVLGLFCALLYLQPDFGSVVIFSAITWIMMFAAGVRLRHLVSILIPVLPLGVYLLLHAEYRVRRILSFLNPWDFPSEEGYQVIHSLLAFGTGGIWGSGLGKGYQKLFYLPEPHTDFIFSVIGEELGLLGVLLIVGLYVIIVWKGILISRRASNPFCAFTALGITVSMGIQTCVNMGVAMGLLPTKGLTLPFLSYGGTSLVVNMAAIGLLLNIAAAAHRESRPPAGAGKRSRTT